MQKGKKRILYIVIGVVVLGWIVNLVDERLTPAVGVLELDGAIMSAMPYIETIRSFERDDNIKAVLVRIDSPGGVVGPSQEIYAALLRLKQKKTVVASMSSLGASGAYYVACACDSIFALPGTMAGSIGVIMEFIDVSQGLERLGIQGRSITSGKLKDAGSPLRRMTDAEQAYFKALTDDVHAQFVEAVANSRNLPLEQVQDLADGRVFTGRQALQAGLVDSLGGFHAALEELKQRAAIEGEVRLVRPDNEDTLLDGVRRLLSAALPAGGRGVRAPQHFIRLEYSLY